MAPTQIKNRNTIQLYIKKFRQLHIQMRAKKRQIALFKTQERKLKTKQKKNWCDIRRT